MFEKIDPSFFGADIKLCRFCKKEIIFDSKICPFCERDFYSSVDAANENFSSSYRRKIDDPLKVDEITYAGFWRRGAASIADSFILMLIWFLYFFIVGTIEVIEFSTFLYHYVFSLFISFFYYTLFTYSSGSTPGKMLLGIKVISSNDDELTYPRSVARFFSYYLSTLLLFTGYLIQPFTARHQALHDFISNTVVIRFGNTSLISPGLIWFLFIGLIIFIPFFQFLTH
jgi:uncharacterized RDD family membrane protein YckC